MRPRLQRHPAVRHRPEHLSQGLRRCTQLVFEHHVPTFVQDAIPTPTIPKIQSHRVFLLCKVSGLPDCHSDTLRHSRSPFVLRLERVITGSLSHPAWRPAFSSHLIATVDALSRRVHLAFHPDLPYDACDDSIQQQSRRLAETRLANPP